MRNIDQLVVTFLLNASWQILLIVAGAIVSDRVLRCTAARYRHTLWVFTLVLMLFLPIGITVKAFKYHQTLSPLQPEFEIAPVLTIVSEPQDNSISEPENPAEPIVSVAAEPKQYGSVSRIPISQRLALLLMAAYGLSFTYGCFRLFRSWLGTRRIVASAYPVELPNRIRQAYELCALTLAARDARVYCSASISLPITVGVFKPLIIAPESFLHETDDGILISSLGHELAHIARCDYLANLVYEFIYIPLWFHPAAAFNLRRIRQTREQCCDEWVTTNLLTPEIYARSLVRLLGKSRSAGRLASATTIGISETDNLEVRIMSLLKKSKLTAQRRRLLLTTASLALLVSCVGATTFALNIDIDRQDAKITTTDEKLDQEKQEQAREELRRTVLQLEEQRRVAPQSQWREIEARLREVQDQLAAFDRQQPESEAHLREVQRNLEMHQRTMRQFGDLWETNKQRMEELHRILGQLEKDRPVNEAYVTELRKELAEREKQAADREEQMRELQQGYAELQQQQGDRKAKLLYRVEPEYTQDAREQKIAGSVLLLLTIDLRGLPQNIRIMRSLYPSLDQSAIEAARKMQFLPALKNGQPIAQTITVEFYFSPDNEQRADTDFNGGVVERRLSKERIATGQEDRIRRQAELARGAVILMDRAVQIATSKFPGTVLACSLGRDEDGSVFYHVVIINTEDDKRTVTYVWLSAIDGTILKSQREPGEVTLREKPTEGGVLNRKAISLPQPTYPAIAREAHVSGSVVVEITVDEQGNVTAAKATTGHPLLRAAALAAARQAKFAPNYLQGRPAKIMGKLLYNFVEQ